jgi:DNA processing protein
MRLVRELHERLENLTVVSGGAYGIDITAHRAALDCGVPTIIIPAHGLDRIYPRAHRPEAVRALENGGLLTEYPSETEPLGANFLRRNRIIAGLADAVVIVESQERGGSLVTARMACDYNRDLFAFPGRPEDITSNGCNELICSQRAHLIQSADDLIRTMGWTTRAESRQPVQTQLAGMDETLSETQQAIVSLLGEAEDGLQVNLIVMETERPYAEVSSDLLELEVQGLVRSLPGGFYRLVR